MKPSRRVKGPGSYFIKLALAFSLTMLLSFFLVILLLNTRRAPAPAPETVDKMNQLRTFSNDLIEATAEYISETQTIESDTQRERWLERQFQPKVNNLKQKIVAANLDGPGYMALLQASEKLVALGESQRPGLLSETKQQILKAQSEVEREIRQNRVQDHLTVPPSTQRF